MSSFLYIFMSSSGLNWLRAEKNVHAGQILKDKLTLLILVFLCLFVFVQNIKNMKYHKP